MLLILLPSPPSCPAFISGGDADESGGDAVPELGCDGDADDDRVGYIL